MLSDYRTQVLEVFGAYSVRARNLVRFQLAELAVSSCREMG